LKDAKDQGADVTFQWGKDGMWRPCMDWGLLNGISYDYAEKI
jgi:hypothetical protein